MGDFGKGVQGQVDRAKAALDLVPRKIALEVSRRVIVRTPVDTGRARGSWMPSLDSPARVDPGTLDRGEGAAVARAAETATRMEGDTAFYLTSNLDYMPGLEEGHSKQAPAGMVGITVQEFSGIAGMAVRTWHSAGQAGGWYGE
ncbi:MAG: hypothetical protein KQJ78_07695 [Deltaproteobacteria bacterium]|nr:hypothetical protein [Deltaproteobacteria bacterium]